MGGPSPWHHLGRIATGLSLVATEIVKRSKPPGSRAADIGTVVSTGAKATLLAITDFSGITKGKPREFSNPQQPSSSLVYFDNPPIDSSSKPLQSATSASPSIEPNEFNLHAVDSGNSSAPDSASVKPPDVEKKRRKPRERRVLSTPFSRALGFAGLGAGLAWGTVQESTKRLLYGGSPTSSAVSSFLSEKNAERLALALCRMRGAALKVGQMLSIQDETLIPKPILTALEIVRQGADVMPRSQLNKVLAAELGRDWAEKLKSFDYEPLAAASIGQVHKATLKDGMEIAVKIQYPGVAESIDSDIENVKLLLKYTNLIPKGLFLDNAMKVARKELSLECDYELEAANQKRFRSLINDTKGFYVPLVVDQFSSKRVLATELVSGIPVDKVAMLDQRTRNYVGTKLLEITLLELFVYRFMQTDPNWSNFLYDEATWTINMIDFGAARVFTKRFVDDYLRMVVACANKDGDAVIRMSRELGFITGEESDALMDAHVEAGFMVGLPFSASGGYDFGVTRVAEGVSSLGATMLKHRLTPPPEEAYSLHRKLSGAFLACLRLRAVVPCREMLYQIYQNYEFGKNL